MRRQGRFAPGRWWKDAALCLGQDRAPVRGANAIFVDADWVASLRPPHEVGKWKGAPWDDPQQNRLFVIGE